MGYDLTSGLGSVNPYNLVNAWSAEIVPPAATLTPASLTFASTVDRTASAAQTITLKNTSAVTLNISGGGINIGAQIQLHSVTPPHVQPLLRVVQAARSPLPSNQSRSARCTRR